MKKIFFSENVFNNFFLGEKNKKNKKNNFFLFFKLMLVAQIFFATSCKPTRTFIADQKVSQYKVSSADEKDSAVEIIVKPFRDKMSGQMNEVIGTASKELSLNSKESTLGNWVCDVMLEQSLKFIGTKADVAITNSGGLRIKSISKGNITVSKIYELMPFDNILLLVQCDSAAMQQTLDVIAQKGGGPFSGARFEISNGKAANITIGGAPLQSGRNYWLATIDYLLVNSGGDLGFLKPLPRKDKGVFLRDVLIEGVRTATRQGKSVEAKLDGRIKISQ